MEISIEGVISVLRSLGLGLLVLYVFHILRRKYLERKFAMEGIVASWWNPLGVEQTFVKLSKKYRGGEAFLKFVEELSKPFGNTSIFYGWIFSVPIVVASKAESVEFFLSSNTHIEKSKFYDLLHSWLGQGLLTSGGSRWRSRRKMITPTFHFRILEDFMDVFNEQAVILANKVKQKAEKETEVFDISADVTSCTLDIICETAMGISVNAQTNPEQEYVKAIYSVGEAFVERIFTIWEWPQFMYNLGSSGRKFNKQVKLMQDFATKVINERKKEVEQRMKETQEASEIEGVKKRTPFLNLLLERHLKEKDLTLKDIREEVDTFMFEGHDTTAMGISWTLFMLAENVEAQRKVHAELDEIFPDGTDRHATTEDLSKMKYLECCIKESQRLFPSVPMVGRTMHEDARFRKSLVCAGTEVIIYIFGLHRDPRHFPDPERFDPDRFLPQNCEGRHPYAYVPFSAGPRNCVGQKFAMNEEKVVLSWVLRKVQLETKVKREDLHVLGELVTRSQNGMLVTAKPR